jgi:hypothetical protein
MRGDAGIAVPALREDGSFEQDDLAPGVLSLVAYLRTGAKADLRASRLEIGDLTIVAGETNRDPRIQGLTIRGTAATLTLRVTDRSGAPIERAAVECAGAAFPVLSNAAGVTKLRPASLPADVRVSAFGYRDVQMSGVAADRDVALEPGLRVRLTTDAKPQGHDPDYQLGFFLHHVDAEGRLGRMVYAGSFPYDRMSFDADGQATLPVPGPGAYDVVPKVFVSGKDGVGRGGGLPIRPLPRITVQEVEGLQTFRIAIPQSVVDAAVREHDR